MTTVITHNIGNTLNQLLKLYQLTEAELARKIQIPRATINRLASGRTPDPRASTLNAIAEFFNISVDQLLGNKPLPHDTNSKATAIDPHTSIPLFTWDESINWLHNIPQEPVSNSPNWISIDHSAAQGKFALKVQGEAMWPQFQDNSILVINPDRVPNNRDYVICYLKENNEVIFRQLLIDGKTRLLKPINNMFPTITLTDYDKIIGVIIQTRNNYL